MQQINLVYEGTDRLKYDIVDKQGKLLFTVYSEFVEDAHYYDNGQVVEEIQKVVAHFDTHGVDPKIIYDRYYQESQEAYWKAKHQEWALARNKKRQADPQWHSCCHAAQILAKGGLKAEAKKLIQEYRQNHEYC
ncbi:MAG: hypothetical protein J6V53_07120 [Alphaproteobacteria bacterium]|nr:hypothetical protein [Alphaproteobacteria bacterium]